jgi:tetratricopeptide (TPR) repeat protein
MRKIAVLVLVLLIGGFAGLWANTQLIEQADMLYEAAEYTDALALLESEVSQIRDEQDQAEVYWRMSRLSLFIGDDLEDEGASKGDLLDIYDQGVAYAEKAIALQPSADAYYWKSSNTGRWGETKGILNSLSKSKPMHADLEWVISFEPNYPDAWYVFGRLYFLLPGGFISFGNTDYAVSFARRAIDVYQEPDLKISYYKSLAEMLHDRDWSSSTRGKEYPGLYKDFSKARTLMEQMRKYEGFLAEHNYKPRYASAPLKQLSDRQEAQQIVDWLESEYAKIPDPSRGEKNNMKEVREMVGSW